MHEDLARARYLLGTGSYTCVLVRGDACVSSAHRGVKPLVDWLDGGADLRGFCAADKVVGKATAFLYCLLGVKAVHAGVMSGAAKAVLEEHGIEASCETEVRAIINRRGDGPCPFEAAVWDICDPRQALDAIHARQRELNIR